MGEPSPREERLVWSILDRAFLRDMRHAPQDPAPPEWHAFPIHVHRARGGLLAALYFPPPGPKPRGIVLFGHPGIPPAKGYFHRSDRIPFVRSLGYGALTFDHGGFGESDDPAGLYHHEWRDVLAWARRRHPGVPLHVWGVSLGGYFAHHALAADEEGIASAVFEQVTPDLLQYGARGGLKLAGGALALVAGDARRWFAAETHAPRVAAEHVLYVSGTEDHGITREQAARLAEAAGPFARHHVVEGAGHLDAWKLGGEPLRKAVADVLQS